MAPGISGHAVILHVKLKAEDFNRIENKMIFYIMFTRNQVVVRSVNLREATESLKHLLSRDHNRHQLGINLRVSTHH